ncbi:hypothetical protein [Amycolatopsis sp. DG1A-15b]|uniref:hypothetical protein n=1 Tax=Amycolatopsis sp. DG1A-15b TaxID=3052846 RepID=UPI00255BD701|nr:hypothetical protein [Amycolatopsis sp. DG1A-15b]WIX89136.1 hypothetical protein QRY02_01395 [Amycolatopsis sp. DG1A-15b]
MPAGAYRAAEDVEGGQRMRLAGREWRTLVSTARLDGRDHRVIRPARPIAHASLAEGRHGAQLWVGQAAAADLACAWWLAARSPRSIVHLPLRSGAPDCGGEHGGRLLDLVLLHHSLAFPVSGWKRLRARLSPPAPHKVTLPPRAFPPVDHTRRWYREFRDHLHWRVAADTLFVTGSRPAYEFQGEQVRALAEDAPARLAEDPGAHCCAEIELGTWSPYSRRNPLALLHVECCVRHG